MAELLLCETGPATIRPAVDVAQVPGFEFEFEIGFEIDLDLSLRKTAGQGVPIHRQGCSFILQVSRFILSVKPVHFSQAEMKAADIHLYQRRNGL